MVFPMHWNDGSSTCLPESQKRQCPWTALPPGQMISPHQNQRIEVWNAMNSCDRNPSLAITKQSLCPTCSQIEDTPALLLLQVLSYRRICHPSPSNPIISDFDARLISFAPATQSIAISPAAQHLADVLVYTISCLHHSRCLSQQYRAVSLSVLLTVAVFQTSSKVFSMALSSSNNCSSHSQV